MVITIVNHLDVVTRASLTNPVTAGFTVDLSSGFLEDLLDGGPGSGGTTRHERGTVTSALLTARDTRADEKEALGLKLLGATDGIRVVGVTTIDDDVTLLQVGLELLNEAVDGRTGLDKEDDLAGALEFCAELLDRVGALDIGTCNNSFSERWE
jgi:hypothetical protein